MMTRMNLKDIMLTEINQLPKGKHGIFPLTVLGYLKSRSRMVVATLNVLRILTLAYSWAKLSDTKLIL